MSRPISLNGVFGERIERLKDKREVRRCSNPRAVVRENCFAIINKILVVPFAIKHVDFIAPF